MGVLRPQLKLSPLDLPPLDLLPLNNSPLKLIFRSLDVSAFSKMEVYLTKNSHRVIEFTFIHECSNKITSRDCEVIAETLRRFENIETISLFLRLNKINEGISSIAEVLPSLPRLKKLVVHLQSNCISNSSLANLSTQLNLLHHLEDVEILLYGNEITDLSMMEFSNMRSLVRFNL